MTAETAVRAVLWDFGGVITTSPFDAFAAYERANGLPAGFIRGLNSRNPDTNAWAQFERGSIDHATFAERFEAEALAAGGRLDAQAVISVLSGTVRPQMLEAVRRVRTRFATALLTNNMLTAGRAGGYDSVLEHFDVIVESSVAGVRKPDPVFYEIACDKLGIQPSQAVFLDDLGINLKPAKAMGMTTIKVLDPLQALSDLERALGEPAGWLSGA